MDSKDIATRNMLFDLIITAFNSGAPDFEHRCKNLNRSLSSIPDNVRVIIVEQTWLDMPCFIDNIEESRSNLLTHKIKFNKPFNKSWLYNYAVKNLTNSDNLIFGETDVLFPDDYFNELYQHITESGHAWTLGWDKINYLTHDGKTDTMSNLSLIPISTGGGCWGMALYINKLTFENIGGYNEFIQGAAVVDNDIAARLIKFTGEANKFNHTLTHLYHERNKSEMSWGTNWGHKYPFVLENSVMILSKLNQVYHKCGGEKPLFYTMPGYLNI
jgi:hypothetical protein